jgi:hypothetical protein
MAARASETLAALLPHITWIETGPATMTHIADIPGT